MEFRITQTKELHFVVVINGVCVATFEDFGLAMMADKIALISKKQDKIASDVNFCLSRINNMNDESIALRNFVKDALDKGMTDYIFSTEIDDRIKNLGLYVKDWERALAEHQAEFDKLAIAKKELRKIAA